MLGLTEAFEKDPNPEKINLGTGIHTDDRGRTPTLSRIVEAGKITAGKATSGGGYPPPGLAEDDSQVVGLLFGAGSDLVASGRAVVAQTPGGTGGLRVAGDFIKKTASYPHYDTETKGLDFDGPIAALKEVPTGDVVLPRARHHNPPGMDPDAEQWRQLAEIAVSPPLFDFAHQGFGEGIEEDAFGLRAFAEKRMEMPVASSFSKNLGPYNQRVGAMTVVAKMAEAASVAMSHVKPPSTFNLIKIWRLTNSGVEWGCVCIHMRFPIEIVE